MIYAIGDIHGQLAQLENALRLIAADGGDDATIVFLGDYIDRGTESAEVLDLLIKGHNYGRNWTFLKGNHDRLFSNFVRHGLTHDACIKSGLSWLNPRLGGANTLASYGVVGEMHFQDHVEGTPELLSHFKTDDRRVDLSTLHASAAAAVSRSHLDFVDALPLWHKTDDLIFAHAGLRPGIPLSDQTEDDLIWIREPFLSSDQDFGHLIVHGHTALDHPQHFGNRIDLDGGAGYGRPLVPAVFEGRDCWLLTDQGRIALTP